LDAFALIDQFKKGLKLFLFLDDFRTRLDIALQLPFILLERLQLFLIFPDLGFGEFFVQLFEGLSFWSYVKENL
jgi:hypothetical protein